MMRFLDGKAATSEIEMQVETSNRIQIAVAFWGQGSIEELGLLSKGSAATVVCNLTSGGTNPKAIRALMDAGVHVTQCDNLHGKVYAFDSHVVLGSSNASANGLSLQGAEISAWCEANIITDDPVVLEDSIRWISALQTRSISPTDLKAADETWSKRRYSVSSIPNVTSVRTLLDAIRKEPNKFADQRVYVCFYTDLLTTAGKSAVRKKRLEVSTLKDETIDGFEDWPELPDQAHLVCFYVDTRGNIVFDGIWMIPKDPEMIPFNGATITISYRKSTVFGVSNIGPIKKWKNAILRLKADKNEKDGFMEIGEFMKRYLMTE